MVFYLKIVRYVVERFLTFNKFDLKLKNYLLI